MNGHFATDLAVATNVVTASLQPPPLHVGPASGGAAVQGGPPLVAPGPGGSFPAEAPAPVIWQDFSTAGAPAASDASGVAVSIRFGQTMLHRDQVGRLQDGTLIRLDNPADAPLDIYLDGRLAARGVAVIAQGKLCVRVSEVISSASLPRRTQASTHPG
jgi:flagellar motor switch protein FliN/FliY